MLFSSFFLLVGLLAAGSALASGVAACEVRGGDWVGVLLGVVFGGLFAAAGVALIYYRPSSQEWTPGPHV